MRTTLTTALALSLLAAPALAQEESLCTEPGLTVLVDDAGDAAPGSVTENAEPPVGLPLDYADILAINVAQPPQADGVPRLVFTLSMASLETLPQLPPNAAWFISFRAPDTRLRGVRMLTDGNGAPSFIAYTVSPGGLNADGPSDGRFVEAGSERAAEAESGFTDGAIRIVVKASDVGVRNPGEILSNFNAAVVQSGTVPGVVSFADTFDTLPTDLTARTGTLTTAASGDCGAKAAASPARFGGALGAALLMPFMLAALRRKLRKPA